MATEPADAIDLLVVKARVVQLSTLVQEFFRQTSQLRQDDTSEALFRDFLGQRATRSNMLPLRRPPP